MELPTILLTVFAYLILLILVCNILDEVQKLNQRINDIWSEGKSTYNGKPIEYRKTSNKD